MQLEKPVLIKGKIAVFEADAAVLFYYLIVNCLCDFYLMLMRQFKRYVSSIISLSLLSLTLSLSGCSSNPPKQATNVTITTPVAKVTQIDNSGNQKATVNDELNKDKGISPIAIKTIVGNGYGNTVDQARRDALNNLAGSIQVDVVKEVKICTNRRGDCGSISKVNTHSQFPILGVQDQRLANEQGSIRFQAWLDSQNSLPIYVRDLDQLSANIEKQGLTLQRMGSANQRYQVISNLHRSLQEYDKKRLVANILGGYKEQPRPNLDINNLKNELKKLERRASTLDFAAQVLVKNISVNDIYLHPPTQKNVQEVTPFASAVKKHISPLLNTVSLPERAEYNMEGEYEILQNGTIFLSYRLIDLNYRVINSNSVIVENSAHQAFRSRPYSVAFETKLNDNVPLSNKFRAEIKTLHGSETLYYQVGDSLKLLVRLSRPGYYYIVGHVLRDGEQFSYLLDLNDKQGDKRFVRYISQQQANKDIEIAEFEVIPPYGAEHLQLIASNKKFSRLPSYTYTTKYGGYYVLNGSDGNATAGLGMARGLRKKQNKRDVLTSEATLTYTTQPRN